MITLYIIRHGETVDNLEGRIQGHTDSSLTPLGVRQAQAVADRLASDKFTAIYSSDLGRAMATAEAIASRHNMPIISTDLLREANLGVGQGKTAEELLREYPEEYRRWKENSAIFRLPGAESLESVIERCGKFIQNVLNEHEDGAKLAVIVHSGSLRGLICAACGLSVDFYRFIHTANASLSILDIGKRPSLKLLNDTCHIHAIEVTELEPDVA